MTEPAQLTATRAAYDVVAADYAELLRTELAGKPLDRALLATFAELAGTGPVADLGCGPGRVTAHLHLLGLEAFGIDLSPAMVAVARRTYPNLRFDVGSITALELADEVLSGIVAWYSIIHTAPELVAGVLAEFHRVLHPGGQVLLAFQVGGNEQIHRTAAYGHEVSLTNYRFSPDWVVEQLREAGLLVHTRVVREPGLLLHSEPELGVETSRQAYLMAQKPVSRDAFEKAEFWQQTQEAVTRHSESLAQDPAWERSAPDGLDHG